VNKVDRKVDKKVDSLLIHQYRHQTGRRQSSIRKNKAQREVLQKGIRGISEDKEDKGDKGGMRGIRRIRRIRGIRKSQFIHQYRHQTGRRQSPIRKKEGAEGSVPRGDKGDKGG